MIIKKNTAPVAPPRKRQRSGHDLTTRVRLTSARLELQSGRLAYISSAFSQMLDVPYQDDTCQSTFLLCGWSAGRWLFFGVVGGVGVPIMHHMWAGNYDPLFLWREGGRKRCWHASAFGGCLKYFPDALSS